MSRPGIDPPGPPRWEASTLEELFEQRHGFPQCMCYMTILEHTCTAQYEHFDQKASDLVANYHSAKWLGRNT
jgi:hypothetical protein